MRVAVNAEQLLYPSPGGIGRYTAQLLSVLPAEFPDVEVVPFTARHQAKVVDGALAARGVAEEVRRRAVVLGLPRPVLYEAWVRLGRTAGGRLPAADLVHAPSVAVPPRGACPLVVTVHDAAVELFPEAFPPRGRRFHQRGLAAAARRADLVITVSEAAADEIVSHSRIPADRLRVVPNGVKPMRVDAPGRDEILSSFGLLGRPYVLWVGSLEPRKGVGTAVAAMARLRRRGTRPEVHTVLVGYAGWLGSGLVAAADREQLGPSLHQLGQVSDEELWALYAGATLMLFPSLHEGFGLPVLEAMSQSTPVVASDIPAVREVAGGAAVLVAPGDVAAWEEAVDGMLGDEAARSRLVEAGLERARMFDLRRALAGIRAVYQEILSLPCGS